MRRGVFVDLEKIKSSYFIDSLNIRQKALELSMSGIAFADLSGRVIYANKAYVKMWGYKHTSEVLGVPIALFCEREDLAWKIFRKVNKTGTWSGVVKGKRADGSLFDVLISICMFCSENDEPVCHLASFSYPGQQPYKDRRSWQPACKLRHEFNKDSLAANSDKSGTLTTREREVLLLSGQGQTSRQIASKLSVSHRTIETHRFNLMQKLDIHTHAGLISYALKKRLLLPEE